jgi:HD-GYP domain-containing protein (c-di-GMP phosphodiesterase class II)
MCTLVDQAALRIQKGAGSQFDPEVAEAFLRALRRDPPWKWKGKFERATLEV